MNNNLLRHELQRYEETTVDIEDVLHNTHNLIQLVKPLVYILRTLDKIRRWETWSLCLVLLTVSNAACFIFEGYFTLFCITIVISLAGLGYTHRRTNILTKFLPPTTCESEPIKMNTDGLMNSEEHDRDIVHSELTDELRLLLCFVNDVTSCLTQIISQIYLFLKWQDLYTSLLCYLLLLVFIIIGQSASTQCLFTLLLDLFLLHFPIYQYFLFIRGMQGASITTQSKALPCREDQTDVDDLLESPVYDLVNDDQAQDTDDNKTTDGDNMEVEQKSEAGSSSDEGGLVELKVRSPNTQTPSDTNSIGKSKKQGVVGKLLKTVKNQGPLGSCEGCKANFTTILKRRRLCSHCGNHFCSRCCNYKVTRSMFGATAPAAQTETVNVCFYCFNYLNKVIHSKLNGDTRAVTSELNGNRALNTKANP